MGGKRDPKKWGKGAQGGTGPEETRSKIGGKKKKTMKLEENQVGRRGGKKGRDGIANGTGGNADLI